MNHAPEPTPEQFSMVLQYSSNYLRMQAAMHVLTKTLHDAPPPEIDEMTPEEMSEAIARLEERSVALREAKRLTPTDPAALREAEKAVAAWLGLTNFVASSGGVYKSPERGPLH